MKLYEEPNNNQVNKNFLGVFSLNEDNNGYFSHESPTLNDVLSKNRIIAIALLLLGVVGLSMFAALVQCFIESSNLSKVDANAICLFSAYASIFAIDLIIICCNKNLRQALFSHLFDNIKTMIVFIIICFAAFNFLNYIVSIITNYFTTSSNNNQSEIVALYNSSTRNAILASIMTIVFAPFVEEVTYRVSIFALFKNNKKSKLLAACISSFIFALIHFNFMAVGSEELLNELANLPSYLVAGFAFGYCYLRSENIFTNMSLHIINNLLATIFILSGI